MEHKKKYFYSQKICKHCGTEIKKDKRLSLKQWNAVVYCSRSCFSINKKHSDEEHKNNFYKYIKKEKNGCHVWLGATCEKGYGMWRIDNKTIRAHRAAWFYKTGEKIPIEKLACHTCDNPSCVNTDHLFIGTAKENMEDMVKKGRQNSLRGEDCPSSLLTNDQVLEIFCSSNPSWQIADTYDVSISTVRAIRNGQNWGHLTGKIRKKSEVSRCYTSR